MDAKKDGNKKRKESNFPFKLRALKVLSLEDGPTDRPNPKVNSAPYLDLESDDEFDEGFKKPERIRFNLANYDACLLMASLGDIIGHNDGRWKDLSATDRFEEFKLTVQRLTNDVTENLLDFRNRLRISVDVQEAARDYFDEHPRAYAMEVVRKLFQRGDSGTQFMKNLDTLIFKFNNASNPYSRVPRGFLTIRQGTSRPTIQTSLILAGANACIEWKDLEGANRDLRRLIAKHYSLLAYRYQGMSIPASFEKHMENMAEFSAKPSFNYPSDNLSQNLERTVVTRTIPFGLFFWQKEAEKELIEASFGAVSLTHSHPEVLMGGVLVALITALAVRNIPKTDWAEEISLFLTKHDKIISEKLKEKKLRVALKEFFSGINLNTNKFQQASQGVMKMIREAFIFITNPHQSDHYRITEATVMKDEPGGAFLILIYAWLALLNGHHPSLNSDGYLRHQFGMFHLVVGIDLFHAARPPFRGGYNFIERDFWKIAERMTNPEDLNQLVAHIPPQTLIKSFEKYPVLQLVSAGEDHFHVKILESLFHSIGLMGKISPRQLKLILLGYVMSKVPMSIEKIKYFLAGASDEALSEKHVQKYAEILSNADFFVVPEISNWVADPDKMTRDYRHELALD